MLKKDHVSLYGLALGAHLKYATQTDYPYLTRSEKPQRSATRLMNDRRGLTYEKSYLPAKKGG